MNEWMKIINFDAEPAASQMGRRTTLDGSTEDCAICMGPPTRPKKLACGHSFCTDCIDQAFAKCQPKCPICGHVCGEVTGNQPRGQMTTQILPSSLAGYERYSTIRITYDIYDGVQDVSEWIYRVGQKTGLFLEVCNSRIYWRRIAFYISNCSIFYPEYD